MTGPALAHNALVLRFCPKQRIVQRCVFPICLASSRPRSFFSLCDSDAETQRQNLVLFIFPPHFPPAAQITNSNRNAPIKHFSSPKNITIPSPQAAAKTAARAEEKKQEVGQKQQELEASQAEAASEKQELEYSGRSRAEILKEIAEEKRNMASASAASAAALKKHDQAVEELKTAQDVAGKEKREATVVKAGASGRGLQGGLFIHGVLLTAVAIVGAGAVLV